MKNKNAAWYQITLKGALDPDWSDWLNGFAVTTQVASDGTSLTLLSGQFVDQAALRGVLNKIWDLNLELVSVFQNLDPSDPDLSDRSLNGRVR